jgi:hypothetical protein
MNTYTGPKCKSAHEALVVYLWEQYPFWVAANQLDKIPFAYAPEGFVGNSGEVRARELARNASVVAEKLHNKVERKKEKHVGLDRCFTYYRWKPPVAYVMPAPPEPEPEPAEPEQLPLAMGA